MFFIGYDCSKFMIFIIIGVFGWWVVEEIVCFVVGYVFDVGLNLLAVSIDDFYGYDVVCYV